MLGARPACPTGTKPKPHPPAPDGALWFTAQSAGKLGRLDPENWQVADEGMVVSDRTKGCCSIDLKQPTALTHRSTGSQADASTAQGPKVCRLFAGGRWIRTSGTAAQKPWICAAFRALRGIGGAPKQYHLIAQPFSSAARTTPSSRAGARFEQVAVCDAARPLPPAGGTTHIYLRPSSARRAIR